MKLFWDLANHQLTSEWMLESSNLRQINICLTAKTYMSLPHLRHCSFSNSRSDLKNRLFKDKSGCGPKLGSRYQTSITPHGRSPFLCANREGYNFFSPSLNKQSSWHHVPETLALCCLMKYRWITLSFTLSMSFSRSMEEGSGLQL